jgi:predicted RNase H-like HicB family nuclease
MDTLVQVYRDGERFVAVDLATDVADQGKTKEEAILRLKKGLKEHYAVLLEMLENGRDFEIITVEVPASENSSSPLIA